MWQYAHIGPLSENTVVPQGYAKTCKLYANSKRTHCKSGDWNPALMNFQARELIDELRVRGYKGTLSITKNIQV